MNIAGGGALSGGSSSLDSPRSPNMRQTSGGAIVMRATNVRRSFGGTVVLDRVSVELRQGEVVLLRGDNGSGKTTLLNILTGSLAPDSGTIDVMLPSGHEHFAFPKSWLRSLNF